jgi:nitrite reductase/ring-hydroxylating ferredoxin subunit
MAKHLVGTVAEPPPGTRKIVAVEGQSIGVFNVGGTFYALKNRCPHQGAPLCLGSLKGTSLPSPPGEYRWGREGEILCCPWHGWEFDVTTGRSIWNPHRCRVRAYEVTVEADEEPSVETYPVTVERGSVMLHV